jgi:hypothetical protein
VIIVVTRVTLFTWFPDHLFAKDRLAINDRRDLNIRRPQVKADAAPIQVTPQCLLPLTPGRHLLRGAGYDDECPLVNVLSHEVIIKGARAIRRVALFDVVSNALGAAHENPPATALPEEEFDQSLYIREVGIKSGVIIAEDLRLETRHRPIRPLKAEHQGYAPS